MTTDFQTARFGLGARLRELRTEAGLSGKDLAARAGWQRSKVSRIETGKQTPSPADLAMWAEAVGRPEAERELKGRLQGLETRYRSWRRQLSGGHRARQESGAAGPDPRGAYADLRMYLAARDARTTCAVPRAPRAPSRAPSRVPRAQPGVLPTAPDTR